MWLGDRPQLHRLWAAGQWRDDLMFEGVPSYPTNGRMGEIVDKHQVNILYTAPTAVRA